MKPPRPSLATTRAKFEPCRELMISDRDAAKAPEEAVRIEEPAGPDVEEAGKAVSQPFEEPVYKHVWFK